MLILLFILRKIGIFMANNIFIIGAGQLGSRHLQSLKLVTSNLLITVIDTSEKSLATAKERYESAPGTNHPVEYLTSMPTKSTPIDVAIVASNSNVRRSIIESLLTCSNVKYLVLEKLLFNSKEDFEIANIIISQSTVKTFVNCPMRMVHFYEYCKKIFNGTPVDLHVTGSQYGLVTSSIHYLDYCSYLNDTINFEIEVNLLDFPLIDSKRPGFKEINGTLYAKFDNGAKTILTCSKDGSLPLIIELSSSRARVICREWEQKAWISEEKNNWEWREIEALIPFQSQMTAVFVNELLESGTCRLTAFDESKKIHLNLLEALKKFLGNNQIYLDHYPFT